jgi:hypothetical protein
MHRKFLSETLKGRDHSEDLGVDGKVIYCNGNYKKVEP